MGLKKSMRNNQQLKDEPAERRLASRIRIYIYTSVFTEFNFSNSLWQSEVILAPS